MIFDLKQICVALMLGTASACSNVMLTYGREGAGHVSSRTMDWASDFKSAVTTFPRGTPLKQHAHYSSNSSTASTSTTADIGFVGVELTALHGVIADGINEHGFGVGTLWMEHPALLQGKPGMGVGEFKDYYPAFNSADSRPALAAIDLAGRLLSSCKSVAEAEALIRSHQIVAAAVTEGFKKLGFCDSTPECNPAIHFTLHDADGKSAVVEFIGEASKAAAPQCFSDPAVGGEKAAPNGGRVCFYDNTASGVMTNEPTLETQRRLLAEQLREKGDTSEGLFTLLQNEFGGYAPPARFGRLSVLNTLGTRASPACASGAACGWSDTKYLPGAAADNLAHPHGFSFESVDPAVDRIAQAARQISTTVRPFGINVVDASYGATQWTVVRDHTHKRYLFNSPATLSFRSVDLGAVGLSTPGPKRSMPLADRQFAFEDVSKNMMAAKGPTSSIAPGTAGGNEAHKKVRSLRGLRLGSRSRYGNGYADAVADVAVLSAVDYALFGDDW